MLSHFANSLSCGFTIKSSSQQLTFQKAKVQCNVTARIYENV